MKIGKLVKTHINQIFAHCDTIDHEEINRLFDREYSKDIFGISCPFCMETQTIKEPQGEGEYWEKSGRYWTDVFIVRGKQVRVSSQWNETNTSAFIQYLQSKEIQPILDLSDYKDGDEKSDEKKPIQRTSTRTNSRYRGNHIGKGSNLLVRNILSNIGNETFNIENWESTKKYFSYKCAYCRVETNELEMDHAIPINKEKLGEHRLGNLVPSCKGCNGIKSGKDFREFLGDNVEAICKIEEYMDSRNYVPLEDNKQIKKILLLAYEELGALAHRYITIINQLFPQNSSGE
jgi:5-methylcytosine-specific restriction endonuclease McrA